MAKRKKNEVQDISDEERYRRIKWLQSIGKPLDQRQIDFLRNYKPVEMETAKPSPVYWNEMAERK